MTHARRRHDRGQALIETMLLTWLMIAFFAAVYQMFQVNQTIYRSMTAVQQQIFEMAFARNQKDTNYTTDASGALVVWSPAAIPEVTIPAVGMFSHAYAQAGVDPSSLRLSSNAPGGGGNCPGLPCKQTEIGSGNYKEPWGGLLDLPGIVASPDFWNAYNARITGGS